MATRKNSTLNKAKKTVTKAAKTVAKAADEYVVEPVGKALGLIAKKPKGGKAKAATKKASPKAKAKTGRKRSTASR